MEAVLEDVIHHRVNEEVVRAGAMLNVNIGALRHPRFPGIANYQLCAAAQRLLHLQADDRVGLGRIRADEEQRLHVFDLPDGVGHCAGPERGREPRDGRRVSEERR